MDKVVFVDGKITLTPEELKSLLLKSWVRGANEGALYASLKYQEDHTALKQMNRNPNKLFINFISKLFQ